MLKDLCYRRGIERYILSPCNKRRGKRFNAVARTSGAAMRERIAVTGLPCADGKGAYQSLETSKGFSSSGYVTMSERNESSSNRKASTTSGSNCVPRPSTMMFLAVSWSKAGLYTRLGDQRVIDVGEGHEPPHAGDFRLPSGRGDILSRPSVHGAYRR